MQAPLLRIVGKFRKLAKRNFGVAAPALQKDVMQQLFLDKLREYKSKSKGGALVEPTPAITKELKEGIRRLENQFNVVGDGSQFPKFSFPEPKYDSINLEETSGGKK